MGGLHKTKQHMVALRFETHARLKQITRERHMSMDQIIAEMLDRAEDENVRRARLKAQQEARVG